MSTKINLQINNPCSKKISDLKKTEAGGYCASCEKEVIDFSNMTPTEIITFFKNKQGTVCGNFKASQLKTYTPASIRSTRRFSLLTGLSFSLLTLGMIGHSTAQTQNQPTVTIEKNIDQTIQGKIILQKEYAVSGVVSDDSGPLPGASILLRGTVIGTETDFDGKFVFPKKLKKGDVLLISFIGYETQKVVISDNGKKSNLQMEIRLIADSCTLLGEVEVKKIYKSKKSLWRKLKL